MTNIPASPIRRISTLTSIVAMLILSLLQRLMGLIGMASLARLLTPVELGAYAFAQSTGQTFVGLFRLGALQGLHVALARRMPGDADGDAGALVGGGILLVAGIAATGSAIMIALVEPIARDIFGAPELAPYMLASTVVFAGQFMSRAAYVGYAGLGRFVEYTSSATAIGVAKVAATVLGALIFGVQGAIWGFAGTTLAGALVFVIGMLRMLRSAGIRIRLQLRRDHLRQIFAIGLPFYGAGVFMIPAGFLAQGAVSRFGSVADLADLRVILALIAVVQLIPQAISGPIISLFSEREGRQKGSGIASAFVHMRWLWVFALVSSGALLAIWPFAVVLIFGSGFPQAVQTGQIAILAFIPTIVGTSLSAGILVGGRTWPLLVIGAVQGAVMIGMAQALIPKVGLVGFFLAQAASDSVAVLMWLAVLGRQTAQSPLRRWMAPLAGATTLLGIAIVLDMLIDETALQRLLASAVLVPTFCAAIAATALSGAERAELLTRARRALADGRAWLRRGRT